MGCDIHAAIEYRNGNRWHALLIPNKYFGRWEDEKKMTAKLPINRDYDLFAILANVRNGHGFAGVKTGDGFDSITGTDTVPLRGVPEDISEEAEAVLSGEHSPTWVTLSEILAFDWTRSTTHCGVVTAVEFEEWDRMKEWRPGPLSWCGDVTGPSVRKVSNEAMRDFIAKQFNGKSGADREAAIDVLRKSNLYTSIQWLESYTHSALQMWEVILPPMLKLAKQYGNDGVRLVMDFDS